MISVLIADDQDLVREGLRMLLDAEPDLTVAGEAADGRHALDQARLLDPDVILMDVRMPTMNGIEATTRLVQAGSRARILMLTTFHLDEYVYHALKAGASGFLLKDASRDQLTGAVRAVAAGETLLAPAITQRLIEDYCSGPAPGAPAAGGAGGLSERELGVVRLVAQGLSNAEIAARLYLSEATIKSHIARILARLGLRDRVQVAVFAYEHGIVRPGHGAPPPGRGRQAGAGGRGIRPLLAWPGERDRDPDADHRQAAGPADQRVPARRPGEPGADRARGQAPGDVGDQPHAHGDQGEQQHLRRNVPRSVDELGQDRAEQDERLRVGHADDEPVTQRAPAVARARRRRQRRRERVPVPDRLDAEEDQVERAGQLDEEEHFGGTLQQRAEPDRHARGHHVVAHGVPGRGCERGAAPVRKRAADHEQHSRTWDDDDDERREREADQVPRRDHAPIIARNSG